jgi:hypothetical protein
VLATLLGQIEVGCADRFAGLLLSHDFEKLDWMDMHTPLDSSYFKGASSPALLDETISALFDRITSQIPDRDALIARHCRWIAIAGNPDGRSYRNLVSKSL